MINTAAQVAGSQYQIQRFKAMCSLAFHAFLRVGEITSSGNCNPPLQYHQLSKLLDPSQKVVALKVTFHDFKHHNNQRPFSLTVHSQTAFCPVRILLDYLALRGNRPGALFITLDGAPVTRSAFTDQLALAIQLCGLDPSRYKGHSFRIGAASHAAERGMSDAQIRILGRWKSNAFHRYIRVPSLPC